MIKTAFSFLMLLAAASIAAAQATPTQTPAPAKAAPALSIRLASQVEISWPAGFSHYQLQTSATLSNWSILAAASNFVAVVPTNREQFFRLIKP